MAVPASRYQPSPRNYVETIAPFEYASGDVVRRVQHGGHVSFFGRSLKARRLSVAKPSRSGQRHRTASSMSSSEPR